MAKQSKALIALTQKMLDKGAEQAEQFGFRWDNSHPTFRAINAAFNAGDMNAAEACWKENFC